MWYVRCPTCHFLLADKELPFKQLMDKVLNDRNLTQSEKELQRGIIMDRLGIKRVCCRMRVLGNVHTEHTINPRDVVIRKMNE